MPAVDLTVIRQALKTQLKAGAARPVDVYAYEPANPNYPCLVIVDRDPYIAYHVTMGPNQLTDVHLGVDVRINASNIDAGIAMDDWLSVGTGKNSSVVDIIEADRSLGGVVDDCVTEVAAGWRRETDNAAQVDYFAATVNVAIIARRG